MPYRSNRRVTRCSLDGPCISFILIVCRGFSYSRRASGLISALLNRRVLRKEVGLQGLEAFINQRDQAGDRGFSILWLGVFEVFSGLSEGWELRHECTAGDRVGQKTY